MCIYIYILYKLVISMFFESHISLTGLYQAPILAAKKLAIFHTSLVCFLTFAVLSLLKALKSWTLLGYAWILLFVKNSCKTKNASNHKKAWDKKQREQKSPASIALTENGDQMMKQFDQGGNKPKDSPSALGRAKNSLLKFLIKGWCCSQED